jgi:hypothetical protein
MEEEFPGNSFQHSTQPVNKVVAAGPAKPASTDEKKVEVIVVNEVLRRKKPLGRRFLDVFVGDNSKGVAHYVVMGVIVPAAKDAIADAVTETIERVLFGESRSSSRRSRGSTSGGRTNYVNYGRYSTGSSAPVRDEPRRDVSRMARAHHLFDEIVFQTRAEAQDALEQLVSYIKRYESASVADFYGLVDTPASHVDDKWGWHNLDDAMVQRVRNGFILDLPKTEPLD